MLGEVLGRVLFGQPCAVEELTLQKWQVGLQGHDRNERIAQRLLLPSGPTPLFKHWRTGPHNLAKHNATECMQFSGTTLRTGYSVSLPRGLGWVRCLRDISPLPPSAPLITLGVSLIYFTIPSYSSIISSTGYQIPAPSMSNFCFPQGRQRVH